MIYPPLFSDFHCSDPSKLLSRLHTFQKALKPELSKELGAVLKRLDADPEDQDSWEQVPYCLKALPHPVALREWVLQYLLALLGYVASSEEPSRWIRSDNQYHQRIMVGRETGALLDLCLKQKIEIEPSCWLKLVQQPLGQCLPLDLLLADPDLATLVDEMKRCVLVEFGGLTQDLDWLTSEPAIQAGMRLHETAEARIYLRLQNLCDDVEHEHGVQAGYAFYSLIRHFLSKHSYFTSMSAARDACLKARDEASDEQLELLSVSDTYISQLIERAYVDWAPDSDMLALCPDSGLPMDFIDNQWRSLSTNPETQRGLNEGWLEPKRVSVPGAIKGMVRLHPQLQRYWYLPGQLELAIAQAAIDAGWTVTYWPKRDQIDLLLEHPKSDIALALDAKDWRDAFLLGRKFEGFKSYSDTSQYRGIVVVPDHRCSQKGYRAGFQAGMRTSGHSAELMSLSQLVNDVLKGAHF